MLSGFDHVTLAVPELPLASERVQALLGRAPFFTGGHAELGARSALFGLDNAALELLAPAPDDDAHGGAEGLRAFTQAGGALQAVAFSTGDAAALSAQLRERGLRATPPQPGSAISSDGARERHYRTVELSPRVTRGVAVLAVERPEPLFTPGPAPEPGCAHALDHVVVRSADLDAACRLYAEQLGIRLALDRTLGGTRMLFFRIGGVTLEVVHDPNAGDRDALWGAAYRVRDIDAAHARLLAGGFAPSAPRDGRKPGTRVLSIAGGVCGVPTLIIFDPSRG